MVENIPLTIDLHDGAVVISPLIGHSAAAVRILQDLSAVEADIAAVMEWAERAVAETIR